MHNSTLQCSACHSYYTDVHLCQVSFILRKRLIYCRLPYAIYTALCLHFDAGAWCWSLGMLESRWAFGHAAGQTASRVCLYPSLRAPASVRVSVHPRGASARLCLLASPLSTSRCVGTSASLPASARVPAPECQRRHWQGSLCVASRSPRSDSGIRRRSRRSRAPQSGRPAWRTWPRSPACAQCARRPAAVCGAKAPAKGTLPRASQPGRTRWR